MDFQVTPIQNSGVGEPVPPGKETPVQLVGKPSFWIRHKMKIILGSFVVVVIGIGLIYIFGRSSFSEGQVDFKIEGQTEITSGELVNYKITYKNNNSKVGLLGASLEFVYPTDAIPLKDGSVSTSTREVVDIGDLGPGQSGEKNFSAYIIGDRGNIKTARGMISFKAEGISSTFEKDTTIASTITDLTVPLTLVVPPSIVSGQTVTYLVDYRNQSDQDFSDLRLKLKYPDGFRFNSASPVPTSGQDTWDISNLKQGSGSRITIQGTISGSERDTKTVSLSLQKKITTAAGDIYIDFEKTEASSTVATPYLSVKLKLNDSTNYVAHLGDDLVYTVNFGNLSNVDMTGLTLTAKLEGSMYDFGSIRSSGYFDSRENTITWDQSMIPELGLLKSDQHGQTEFRVKLKSSFPGSGSNIANSAVKASVHLETPNIPSNLDTEKLATDDQISTRISSTPTFDQALAVNDPQWGSAGPFPPKVDSKTVFTVHWILTNPSSDVSGAKVTAVLQPGVKWENQIRSGNGQPAPSYNSKNNTVTWSIGTLPGGTGITSAKYEAWFQISITPSVNQIGQSAPLLKTIKFEGADAYTQEKITRNVSDTSTANVSDSDAGGNVQAK